MDDIEDMNFVLAGTWMDAGDGIFVREGLVVVLVVRVSFTNHSLVARCRRCRSVIIVVDGTIMDDDDAKSDADRFLVPVVDRGSVMVVGTALLVDVVTATGDDGGGCRSSFHNNGRDSIVVVVVVL